jgi:hypothetical protein
VDDFADQLERMVGGEAEPDERHVGVFSCGDRAHFADVDFACDHFVAEASDDLGEEFEPVAPLVGDQNPEVLDAILGQRLIVGPRDKRHGRILAACDILGFVLLRRAVSPEGLRGHSDRARRDSALSSVGWST